jgi:cell division protein FtsI (penicillin-binding protein 3)
MEARKGANFFNVRYWSCCRLFWLIVLSGVFLILFKAFQLQVVEHRVWLERERAQSETTLNVPAYRGSIFDRQNRILSYSVRQRSLFADDEQIEHPKLVAEKLSPILEEPGLAIQKKLTMNRHFVWIKRHLSDQQEMAVDDLKARGLNMVDEYKRFYPFRQVAGQIIGFAGMDGTGLEGIEKAFDKDLKEDPMKIGLARDGVKRPLWLGSSLPPDPLEGIGVRLTLDMFIQYITECELEKITQQFKAKAGEIIVMDARTAEILAIANWPFFDPNGNDKKNADTWRNRAVTDFFEPGSTFKVFLMSAALEEKVVNPKERIFCENGKFHLIRNTINDVHPHGWLAIPDVIKYSSNIGASKIALQLGSQRYYKYIRGFGFGSATGIAFPGEAKGLVRPWKRWRPIDLATTGFGQGVGVTALQLTQGIECIANGGECIQPLLVRDIVDANGNVIKEFQPKSSWRVIQKETARQIRDMMLRVTQEGGTGVKAVPEGYTVAGKTGTAQVLDPETGRYASNKYTSVFTGFVPAENPRLVITVVVHEPHGSNYGGVVAAPAFRNIAANVLPYLGVLPEPEPARPPVKVRTVDAGEKVKAKKPAPVKCAKSEKHSPVAQNVSWVSLEEPSQCWTPLKAHPKAPASEKSADEHARKGVSPVAGKSAKLVWNETSN